MKSLESISRVVGIFLCCAMFATSAVQAGQPTGMVVLTGTCNKLTISGKDRTADCKGKLLNTDYSDGRTGFYFVTVEGFAVTFSTRGDRQVKPDENTVISPVDMLLVKMRGRIDRIAASGSCKFTNPYRGRPAPIECRAESALGVFEASVISDGSKPDRTL